MSTLDKFKSRIQAVDYADMTVPSEGGEYHKLDEGYYLGRMVEYIELGMQPDSFEGKEKAPVKQFRIGFMLWGEGATREDGTGAYMRSFPIKEGRNPKSTAFKCFSKLNWADKGTAFAHLLGDPVMVSVVDYQAKDGTTKCKIDLTGFLPPIDPITKKPYPVPDAPDDAYKIFLWDNPTPEDWASLYIDSNNFVQETILNAKNFPGSLVELMLSKASTKQPKYAPAAGKQPKIEAYPEDDDA